MDIIQTVLAIIVALGVLVTVHEWGHFIVARMCGVKVLKFSVGFGRALFSRFDSKGTEFIIAAIPLGGYVKMVDEREGDVAPEDLPFAFNTKPVLQRIAIVAAGPLVNLIFAVLVYWVVFLGGQQVLAPIVGHVEDNSIAQIAGLEADDEVVGIEGKAVNSWDEFAQYIVLALLEPGEVELKIVKPGNDLAFTRTLQITQALKIDDTHGPLEAIGIEPHTAEIPAKIGEVVKGLAADKGGLLVGDEVVSVNGLLISGWGELVEHIQTNLGKELSLEVKREGVSHYLIVVPEEKVNAKGEVTGHLGVGVAQFEWPAHLVRKIEHNPLEALQYSVQKTYDNSALILLSTWKLVTGDLAKDNLGGPIMIAKLAGRYASYGIEPYLMFIAYISIVLGIMNLLPIPVLDGGHIFFFLIELLAGKPVPENIQMFGMKMGLTLLLMIMLFAVYNDISKIIVGS